MKNKIHIISLDFDGTLVESNQIKNRAFEKIFNDWPNYKKSIMSWHLSNNAIDREQKFRYFVNEILNQKHNKNLVYELCERFNDLTLQAIIECPMVRGAKSFLDRMSKKTLLYLVSATPQKELDLIMSKRKIFKYFKKIYGAPIKKKEILYKILKENNILSNQMLYIGDSIEDQRAAEYVNVNFIGRRSEKEMNESSVFIFNNFFEIEDYINSRFEIEN